MMELGKLRRKDVYKLLLVMPGFTFRELTRSNGN